LELVSIFLAAAFELVLFCGRTESEPVPLREKAEPMVFRNQTSFLETKLVFVEGHGFSRAGQHDIDGGFSLCVSAIAKPF
jgi:hypothetical protein